MAAAMGPRDLFAGRLVAAPILAPSMMRTTIMSDAAETSSVTAESTASAARRIRGYMLSVWPLLVVVLTCIIISSLLGLVPPLLIRAVIDSAIPAHDRTLLNWIVAAMVATAVASGILGVFQNYVVAVMAHNIMFDLRSQMYDRVVQQSMRFFTITKGGEILSRIQNDVHGVQTVLSGTLVTVTADLISFVTTFAVILYLDWRLTLVAIGMAPLFIVPMRRVGGMQQKLSGQTQENVAELASYVQETLSVEGHLVARLFGAQAYAARRFRDKASALRNLQVRQSMAGRGYFMFVMTFMSLTLACTYYVGGHEAIAGRMTVGTLMAFVFYLGRLYMPAHGIMSAYYELMRALALFKRIFQYLDLQNEIVESATPVRLERPRGEIHFNHVSMEYERGQSALEDITFTARPGQMVALVGASGAGKTTLAYLVSRLHDPCRGEVTFDGVDLRALSLSDLSLWTAKVTQQPILFHTSVEENLRYGKTDASAEELERACRQACIHDVIAALPNGYQTVVGERGYKLSGGEKQRLALARVMLRDPRVLILDEATSSLDSISEELIQRALETLLAGRTSLVIAHRLSTIRRADLILVLDRGRIVERGTHGELLARRGRYFTLFTEQLAATAG
jgi:ATP-binding cassette, subfamily B, bacterial